MLSEQELKSLADHTLTLTTGYTTELMLTSGDSALTRYGENVITQNVASQTIELSVRLLKQGKMGKASTGNLSPEGIAACVATAKASLEVTEVDDDLLDPPSPQSYEPSKTYAQASADATPELRADGIVGGVGIVRNAGLQAAGIFSNSASAMGIANSNGLWAYHRSSNASFSISAMSGDSSGWAQDEGFDIDQIDPLAVAEIANEKALMGREPVSVEPGEWTVVLEPAAVTDLLMFISWYGFNGLSFCEDRSCFSGKVGQQVVGKNITIRDDCYHPLTGGMTFDFEGMPKKAVTLIENGVFKSTVHDRKTAKRLGVECTGHGMPQPDSFGPVPANLIIEPGDSTIQEMVASTKRGLLVTRLHYVNLLNPMTLTITGMTRDGLFLIEDGKVTKGVKNLRFTESILHALNNVEAISKTLHKTETFWGGGGTAMPSMKLNNFHFTSKTEN